MHFDLAWPCEGGIPWFHCYYRSWQIRVRLWAFPFLSKQPFFALVISLQKWHDKWHYKETNNKWSCLFKPPGAGVSCVNLLWQLKWFFIIGQDPSAGDIAEWRRLMHTTKLDISTWRIYANKTGTLPLLNVTPQLASFFCVSKITNGLFKKIRMVGFPSKPVYTTELHLFFSLMTTILFNKLPVVRRVPRLLASFYVFATLYNMCHAASNFHLSKGRCLRNVSVQIWSHVNETVHWHSKAAAGF